jgi:hypothetical protein
MHVLRREEARIVGLRWVTIGHEISRRRTLVSHRRWIEHMAFHIIGLLRGLGQDLVHLLDTGLTLVSYALVLNLRRDVLKR